MEQLPTILGALVLATVLWVLKGTADNTRALAVLQSTIDNIVQPELIRLRDTGHEIRGIAQKAVSNTEVLALRLTQVEREVQMLWDGTDRRLGHDRREEP